MVKEKNKKITPTQEKKSKKKSPTAKKTVVKKSKGNKKNGYIPELKKYYKDVIIGNLTKKFNYSTVMECPRVVKIILNMGVGDAKVNAKSLKSSVNELTVISGQKPIITKAKTDISRSIRVGSNRLSPAYHSVSRELCIKSVAQIVQKGVKRDYLTSS